MPQTNELLEIINSAGGYKAYRISRDAQNAWKAAFNLYKKEHPRYNGRVRCESCRKLIYNWLSNA